MEANTSQKWIKFAKLMIVGNASSNKIKIKCNTAAANIFSTSVETNIAHRKVVKWMMGLKDLIFSDLLDSPHSVRLRSWCIQPDFSETRGYLSYSCIGNLAFISDQCWPFTAVDQWPMW